MENPSLVGTNRASSTLADSAFWRIKLIRDNKTFRITSELQTGAKYGMNTLDSHLMSLYESGKISYGELITKAQDAGGIVQKLTGNA